MYLKGTCSVILLCTLGPISKLSHIIYIRMIVYREYIIHVHIHTVYYIAFFIFTNFITAEMIASPNLEKNSQKWIHTYMQQRVDYDIGEIYFI